MEAAIDSVLLEMQPKSMGFADLGCSTGPNSLTMVYKIIDKVDSATRQMGQYVPELMVSLNDLPSNDFNHVFESLAELYRKVKKDYGIKDCYVSGVPGSFYGRLFPAQSLHIVHSSSSLHWLSKTPSALEPTVEIHLNKEKVYISKSSPESVAQAYQQQFQDDFSLFLRSRSKEIVPKGRMVLSFTGRKSSDPSADEACYNWEIFAQSLMSLALDGLIEKDKIDSFNIPLYAPCMEEVKNEVVKEGSFDVYHADTLELGSDLGGHKDSCGILAAKSMRAIMEPMLENHFQLGPDMMDELFRRHAKIVDGCYSEERYKLYERCGGHGVLLAREELQYLTRCYDHVIGDKLQHVIVEMVLMKLLSLSFKQTTIASVVS